MVAPFLRDFYKTHFNILTADLAESTKDGYREVINTYILREFGDTRLSDITTGEVNRWVKGLILRRQEEGLRPLAGATLNGYANILRAFVNYAVEFGIIEESPFKRPLKRQKVNKPKNELTEDECAAFLQAFRNRKAFLADLRARHRTGTVASCARYPTPRAFGGNRRWDSPTATELWQRFRALRPFFVVALTTGLRLGDLCRLSWSDVRWKEGWIQLVMGKTKREVDSHRRRMRSRASRVPGSPDGRRAGLRR
jgi:integrase